MTLSINAPAEDGTPHRHSASAEPEPFPSPSGPTSLLEGLHATVCARLGVAGLRHRSALLELCGRDTLPANVVAAIYDTIAANWRRCRSANVGSRSAANWRWRAPVLGIAAHNASPEVVLERALVGACERSGRTDWSNQVPVASGVAGSTRERRRAIDLVHQRAEGHFQFIELKVASDTPLYAAIEIIAYSCIWLLSRGESNAATNPLLAAHRVEAKVLAPAAYYARYQLAALERWLDQECRVLGQAHGVDLQFGFECFDNAPAAPPYSDETLLALLDQRRPL